MTKAMILWTGGVESTSLLLWALQHTDWSVYAHHVRLDNPEGRSNSERAAIDKLLPRLHTVRRFSFTTSELSVCSGMALGADAMLVYPIGRVAMEYKGASLLLRGWCWEDEWARSEGKAPVMWGGPGTRFEAIAGAALGPQAVTLAPWLPLYNEAKAQHWARLGEWAELTWSCRRPVRGQPCGKCHSCLEREAARNGTSANPVVAEGLRNAG